MSETLAEKIAAELETAQHETGRAWLQIVNGRHDINYACAARIAANVAEKHYDIPICEEAGDDEECNMKVAVCVIHWNKMAERWQARNAELEAALRTVDGLAECPVCHSWGGDGPRHASDCIIGRALTK